MKLFVFIPAYQAEKTLESVIQRIPPALWEVCDRILVVDDGCTDGTADLVESLARRHPQVGILRHERNQGYGRTVQDGLRAARASDCTHAVCLHADGQYPPEKILELVERMDSRGLDLLQGSRHLDGGARSGGMPLYKLVAGKLLVALENLVFGLRMTDYHSGFLIYSRRALDRIPSDRLGTSFDFDLQVVACCRAAGLRVGEEAIPTRYADEISHLRPIPYGLRVLRVLWRYLRKDFHRLCSGAEAGESV